jgi:ABC-2 type transport system ATP-binding protein
MRIYMHAIEFSHVSKIYRKGFLAKKIPAVVDCSFSVEADTVTGFIGPNGAGKTTSIKMLLGLAWPTGGTIEVFGKNPSDPHSRGDIAFISEQPYFYNHLTVEETLTFAARLHGRSFASLRNEINSSLARVGLEGLNKRKIKDLSKGMQQRCAMAQALLMNSKALILDEPLSGLDPQGRALFRSIICSLAASGATVFFSTHILEDIELVCHNVVALSGGTTYYQGSIDELLKRGFLGTDIVIAKCDESVQSDVQCQGVEISELGTGKLNLFVPAGKDIALCQKYLLSRGIIFESVVKRTTPLEKMLFQPR